MRQKFSSWWFGLQYSLWFLPSVMTILAVLVAIGMIRVDRELLAVRDLHVRWLFEGGAEGARGVLTTIAGTMMTVATTAFSITIVALQLSSSQFSPRILRRFTRDRGNQVVLGIFIATFAYAVIVLRSVRSESSDGDAFVPSASVSLAILLAFSAIASLIFFFHHATRTIQATVIIEGAIQDTFALIENLDRPGSEASTAKVALSNFADDAIRIRAERSGYVTHIDFDALLAMAAKYKLMFLVVPAVGEHLLSTSTLVKIAQAEDRGVSDASRESLEREIRAAFRVEVERTLEHDVLLGFRQVSDVAIKALSPGINDPSTATICIDRLGEALVRMGSARGETRLLTAQDEEGGICYSPVALEQAMDACIPQIRHYGSDDVIVMTHLLRMLEAVALEADDRAWALIAAEARLVEIEAVDALTVPADQRRVHDAAKWAAKPESIPG